MFAEGLRDRSGAVILTYHSLDESDSVLSVSPRRFASHMRLLHQMGARVVPMSEIGRRLSEGASVESLVAIAFDDGYRNVYDVGLPVLRLYGFPATVFLVSDHCGKSATWFRQPAHMRSFPLLSWREVREMSTAGIAFGSHTRTHRDLTLLPAPVVEEEMVASKHAIEDATGLPVGLFAYPYGAYDAQARTLAGRHFRLACSTRLGFTRHTSDPFALERIDVYYVRAPLIFGRLFSPGIARYLRMRRQLRDLRGRLAGMTVARGVRSADVHPDA